MRKLALGLLFVFSISIPKIIIAQGNALNFDGGANSGTNDYVLLPSINLTSFTMEAWVKTSTSGNMTILSKGNGGGTGDENYIFQIQNGYTALYFHNGSSGAWSYSTGQVSNNQWTHVTISYNNTTGTLSFYQNGSSNGTVVRGVQNPYSSGTGNTYVGRQGSICECNYYAGDMDEIRIWNTVRTAGEISANYQKSLSGRESGLVAYYTMNASTGTALADQTNNGYHGTLTNMSNDDWVASGVSFPALTGNALDFDGSNDNVRVLDANSLDWSAAFTFEAWIYRSALSYGTVFAKWDDEGDNRGIMVNFGEQDVNTLSVLATSTGAWTNQLNWNSDITFAINRWYHIAVTHTQSGSNNIKVYVNGVLSAQTTWNYVIDPSNPANLLLGGYDEYYNGLNGGAASRFFSGRMDEVRFWTVERTGEQILASMNTSLTGRETGLAAYFDFNSSTGNKLMDLSLNGNHGTLVNMTNDASDWITSDIWNSGTIATTSGFRLLSAPTTVSYATMLTNVWTQGATGAKTTNGTPNVWTWNNSASGNASTNWTAVANLTNSLSAGQGFLYYHFNDDDFAGGANASASVISVSGTEFTNPTLTINSNLDGWTLIGNPFFSTIDWSTFTTKTNLYADARVWNPATSAWILTSSDSKISPYNSFFVQTFAASPLLSIGTGAKTSGGTFRGKTSENDLFEFALASKSGVFEDEARLRFSTSGHFGRDMYDAEKSTPLSSTFLAIPIHWNDKTYAINSLPLISETVSIPLAVEFTQSGKVAFSLRKNTLPEGWLVELLDTKTGVKMPIGADFSYSFDHVTVAKSVTDEMISPKMETMKTVSEPRFMLLVTPLKTTSNEGGNVPTKLALEQNFPNPFNPSTTIRFALPNSGNVKLEVLNMLGQTVATVANGAFSAGNHTVSFDASKLSSGMYLYRINAGGSVITKKMTLLK